MRRRISPLALVVLVGCSAEARIVSKDSRSDNFVVCSNGRGGKEPLDDVAIHACPAPSLLQRVRCGSQVEGIGTATMTASPVPTQRRDRLAGPAANIAVP